MRLKIRVPATSANLGAGFDCLGMALGLYNTVEASVIPRGLVVEAPETDLKMMGPPENNLVYRAMLAVFDRIGYHPPGLKLVQENGVPIARGMGSSAACIVAGIRLADAMGGGRLTLQQQLELAAELDGHPDNVAPALLGGVTAAAATQAGVRYASIPVPEGLCAVVMIPDFAVRTSDARRLLPETIDRADGVFNLGRAALFAASLAAGKLENLGAAMEDRLHQPYRKALIPGYDALLEAARQAGAYGAALSGSGSTLLALTSDQCQGAVVQALERAAQGFPNAWRMLPLPIDREGPVLSRL
ncbi:MAG: homoserine kinase [Christensenellales bacterium]|jgi:homoserine kinase